MGPLSCINSKWTIRWQSQFEINPYVTIVHNQEAGRNHAITFIEDDVSAGWLSAPGVQSDQRRQSLVGRTA